MAAPIPPKSNTAANGSNIDVEFSKEGVNIKVPNVNNIPFENSYRVIEMKEGISRLPINTACDLRLTVHVLLEQ
jgi:hypothetical protein